MFIERMRDPVLVIDRDSELVVEANAAAVALTGRSRDDLMHLRPSDLFASLDGELDLAPAADVENRHIDVVRPDGTRSTVEFYAGSPRESGLLILVLVDVSQQQAEEHHRSLQRSVETLIVERKRLARDLHDGVVQEVIATGLVLASMRERMPDELRGGVEELIDAQARIVAMLRTSVLDLSQPLASSASLELTLRDIVRQAIPSLGFVPATAVAGGDVGSLDAALVGHIALSLREMLSNIARHSEATAAHVTLRFSESVVEVEVSDNGVGIDLDQRRGNGLSNLAERARLLGGTFEIDAGPSGGARVRWTARIHQPESV